MLDFKRINEQIKNPQIIIKSFIDDMAIPYSCSDIVISRAGALAIEEMKSFNKPMILIPYPNAANNHQKSNALELSNDWAQLIHHDLTLALDADNLDDMLTAFFEHPSHAELENKILLFEV